MVEPGLNSSSGEQFARVGDIELCYETFGDSGGTPLLLIMGLGSQMVLWDEELCAALAGAGFFVIRFDNRDIGRSTILRYAPVPTRMQLLLRDRRAASYQLDDMAADAAGLLDQLGLGPAHVVGASMGGMIAQLVAIRHPDKTRSLVSIMSTTGNRRVGQAHPRMYVRLMRRPRLDRKGYVADFQATFRTIGSRRYPADAERLRARALRSFERGVHPAGSARQLAAIIAARDRTPLLRGIRVPTAVLHGAVDPLVRVSGGRATAAAIPGARLLIHPEMAHDLPREWWPQLIQAVEENEAAAAAERAPR